MRLYDKRTLCQLTVATILIAGYALLTNSEYANRYMRENAIFLRHCGISDCCKITRMAADVRYSGRKGQHDGSFVGKVHKRLVQPDHGQHYYDYFCNDIANGKDLEPWNLHCQCAYYREMHYGLLCQVSRIPQVLIPI